MNDAQVVAFLDLALDYDERRSIEAHLDECHECRMEIIEARRLIDQWLPPAAATSAASAADQPIAGARVGTAGGGSRRRVLLGLAGAALAASLAALMFVRPLTRPDAASPGSARASEAPYTEGLTPIPVVQPANGASAALPATFIWRTVGALRYRLSLVDADGALLWTHDTADTTAVLPTNIHLDAGRVYFWNVEGLTDGVTATTRTQRFTAGR
jgi:hypothetical protein